MSSPEGTTAALFDAVLLWQQMPETERRYLICDLLHRAKEDEEWANSAGCTIPESTRLMAQMWRSAAIVLDMASKVKVGV